MGGRSYARSVLVFGFGPGKAKDLGPVVEVLCPSCHNPVALHHVQSKKAFRLYFVPVVPYGTEDYLLCPVCNRGAQLTEDRVVAVAPMQDLTRRYRAGQVSSAVYGEQVEAFLRQVGLVSTVPDDVGRARDEQLEDLDRLHAEGVLDDEQYAAARRRLLDG